MAAVAASSIVARSSPRIPAGRPSPSCASRYEIPIESASCAQANASSLEPRAPPSSPMLSGPAVGERLGDERRRSAQRRVPTRGHETRVGLHHRGGQAEIGVDGFEVEAAAVAQPTPVDRVGVDALVAQQFVATRLDDGATTDRTGRAGRLALREVPGAGLEAVRLGGERTDRADLHGVAREVRHERLVGERHHLGVVAAADEVDQLVAGDLVGEAGAAVAQDAAFAVEVDQVADRDRLLVVALLLDVARLAGAVAERLILQRALAALVADRTVERVVREQQFEHALLGALDLRGVGAHDLAIGDRGHARHHHHRATRSLDLDHALAAHADR